MKKGKLLIVGLIALLMVGGLILAGCDSGDSGCPSSKGNCDYGPQVSGSKYTTCGGQKGCPAPDAACTCN